jgi:hypothetical protein
MVLRPGFGPGSSARKAGILDRTILPEHIFEESTSRMLFPSNKPYPSIGKRRSCSELFFFKQKPSYLFEQLTV